MDPQIDWADSPPKHAQQPQQDLRRCPPGGMPPFICLSDWTTGNEMHWWGGRSFPHLKHNCPACAAKRSKVWKGYLAALDPQRRSTFIAEVTPNCMDALSAYKLCFGSLRGAVITLHRSSTKINGRVTATVTQANLAGLDLPTCPNIRDSLAHMWQTDHITEDACPEDGRPIVDSPMNNAELAAKNPKRFSTPGHNTTAVYTATPDQLKMLERNRTAKQNGQPNRNGVTQ